MSRPDNEQAIGQHNLIDTSEPLIRGDRITRFARTRKIIGRAALIPLVLFSSLIDRQASANTLLFGELEVTQDWLKANPQVISSSIDVKDKDGKVISKWGVKSNESSNDSTAYEAKALADGTFDRYNPRFKVPIGNVRAAAYLLNAPDGIRIYFAGERTYRGADTAIANCVTATSTCQSKIWPYQDSGATIDLRVIEDNTTGAIIYGNDGNYEGGVGGYILNENYSTATSTIQAVEVQMPSDIRAIPLSSAGMPTITANDQASSTITILATNSERLESGLRVDRINYKTLSGTSESYLEAEIGFAWAKGDYIKNSQKYFAVSNPDRRTLSFGKMDSVNKPVLEKSMFYAHWADEKFKNIPGFIPGSLTVSAVVPLVNNNNETHNWFFGYYTAGATDNFNSTSHAIIGHFLEGTDPSIDPNALFIQDIAYFDRDITSFAPTQREVQFKIVRGQPGFEFPISSYHRFNHNLTFAGPEFFEIGNDYNPKPNAQIRYPGNGYHNILQAIKYRLGLPIVVKNRTEGN